MALFWSLPLILLSLFPFAQTVMADSNLEVATDASFSNQTTNFSAGQTIYVRITTDSSGDKKRQLNLRDNQYNLIQSYTLNKSGDKFSTSLNAPQNEGYYSLEAQITSVGSNTTSVKTIKVGNPTDANVKVSVKNNVSGQSVSTTPTSSPQSRPSQKEDVQGTQDFQVNASPNVESADIQLEQKPQEEKSPKIFFDGIFQFFRNIFSIIWPL